MSVQRLNVCLVLDSKYRKAYHIDEIKNMVDSDICDIEITLLEESKDNDDSQSLDGIMSQARVFVNRLLEGHFLSLVTAERELAHIINPDLTVKNERERESSRVNVFSEVDALNDTEVRRFSPVKVGSVLYEFPDSITDYIVNRTDVVVLLGFNKILRGRILSEPMYGVLSHHSGKLSKYRGRPSSFFQYINGEDEIYLTLQQLTNNLDGGRIVLEKKANISNVKSWREARFCVERLFGSNIVEGLHKLLDPDFEPYRPEKLGTLTRYNDANKLSNVMKCFRKNIRNRYFA